MADFEFNQQKIILKTTEQSRPLTDEERTNIKHESAAVLTPLVTVNEAVILAIIEKYCKAKKLKFEPQYPLGGFVYDCCVKGSVLIEFEELHHSAKRKRKIDADKDTTAADNNFILHRFTVDHDIVDIILALESVAGETTKFKQIAEAYLSEHQETTNFLTGFGKKRLCDCSNCKIARDVLTPSAPFLELNKSNESNRLPCQILRP